MENSNKKTKIRDGWHVVNGWNVYVEDSYAVRGLSRDGQRPLYLYRPAHGGGLDRNYMYCVAGALCGKKTLHKLKVYNGEYVKLHGYKIRLDECLRTGV